MVKREFVRTFFMCRFLFEIPKFLRSLRCGPSRVRGRMRKYSITRRSNVFIRNTRAIFSPSVLSAWTKTSFRRAADCTGIDWTQTRAGHTGDGRESGRRRLCRHLDEPGVRPSPEGSLRTDRERGTACVGPGHQCPMSADDGRARLLLSRHGDRRTPGWRTAITVCANRHA